MKKIFSFLVLGFLAFLFTSCSRDTLEPYTPGLITEEVALQNSTDLRTLMNTSYALMYNRNEIEFSSVFTDEVGIGFANGGQGLINDDAYFLFTLNPNSPVASSVWTGNYIALSRINRVIKYADILVPQNDADAKIIQDIKAEALIMRALAHLRIMSYFSTDLSNDGALAGILANRVFETNEKENPRVTNGEFYTQIHSDLDQAISIFTSTATAFNKTRANSVLAKGLKARAYAYKGNYTQAEAMADQVISTSGLQLAAGQQYANVFWSDTELPNQEVIFRLVKTLQQSSQGSNLGNAWASVNSTKDGSPFFEIGRSLFNILQPSDVRYQIILHNTSVVDPGYLSSPNYLATDLLVLGKHRGGTAKGNLNVDYKVMRLSEMHLIKAEARAAAGDFAGVATALNQLRAVRGGTPYVARTSQALAYADILKERRIELAFEGFRFIDLKRLGTKAGVGIDRHPVDYTSSSTNYPAANPANLPMTSHKWTLPIPTEELTVNPNIGQNPGY